MKLFTWPDSQTFFTMNLSDEIWHLRPHQKIENGVGFVKSPYFPIQTIQRFQKDEF